MNRPRIFISESAEETESFAQDVALNISGTACLCLYGDLGAGKTTFVRGLAKALGIKSKIQSPTFTYNRIHKGRCSLYHFDFYRLTKPDSLLFSEALDYHAKKDGILVIEWPDRMEDFLPHDAIKIFFEFVGENARKISIL